MMTIAWIGLGNMGLSMACASRPEIRMPLVFEDERGHSIIACSTSLSCPAGTSSCK